MNVKSRVERLERTGGSEGERVRFRVVVPPKMTREEWAACVRALTRNVFTVDLGGGRAGVQ